MKKSYYREFFFSSFGCVVELCWCLIGVICSDADIEGVSEFVGLLIENCSLFWDFYGEKFGFFVFFFL